MKVLKDIPLLDFTSRQDYKMSSLTKKTFEDANVAFPVTFFEYDETPYVSHKSLANFFDWSDRKRKREFAGIAEFHPNKVAYFQCDSSRGGQFLTPCPPCTEDFQRLNDSGKIQRFLTKQGMILAVFQEKKHPKAKAFQDFCLSALDTLFSHGSVALPNAATLEEGTKKLDLERAKLKLQQSHANNEKLRLTMGMKRLEIQEKKVENAALIQEKERIAQQNDQLMNWHACKRILRVKGIERGATTRQYEKVKSLVRQLGRPYIIWHGTTPCFRSPEMFNKALPTIRRLRFFPLCGRL